MARSRSISARLRQLVAERAGFLCEYCRLRQDLCPEPFEIEHILPRTAGGPTRSDNLCLACSNCNNAKSDQTMARNPTTGRQVRLFNPRIDSWDRHFGWSEDFGTVVGRTAIGRATVVALNMNQPRVVRIRLRWASFGWHPPG